MTEMVQVPTAEQAQLKIKRAVESGATAIGFQMNALKKEYRTEQTLMKERCLLVACGIKCDFKGKIDL